MLRTITKHQSYTSNADISDLFKLMFPDSSIAQGFSCGRDKTRYLAQFGIAPHFTRLLTDKIRSAGDFVLMFDESLNNATGGKQLDVHLRFWTEDEIQARYFTSRFLGHERAADLLEQILVRLRDLNLSELFITNMNFRILSPRSTYGIRSPCPWMAQMSIGQCLTSLTTI